MAEVIVALISFFITPAVIDGLFQTAYTVIVQAIFANPQIANQLLR